MGSICSKADKPIPHAPPPDPLSKKLESSPIEPVGSLSPACAETSLRSQL